jgi:intracellular sulfur oxidation DsrE/DsrF family protein
MTEHFSEEQLNALVDGELDPEERSRLYNVSSSNAELEKRICRQRKVKELVRYAYEDASPPDRPPMPRLSRNSLFSRALVAGVLFVMGLTAGFVGHVVFEHATERSGGVAAVSPVTAQENYLLHVVSGEPQQMRAALEQANLLLDTAGDDEVVRVEIVANERGIDLLRSDVTPFAHEIADLQDQDVVFYACSRTIELLQKDGIDVVLVPETHKEYTAMDRVVMRMQQGWKYQKI